MQSKGKIVIPFPHCDLPGTTTTATTTTTCRHVCLEKKRIFTTTHTPRATTPYTAQTVQETSPPAPPAPPPAGRVCLGDKSEEENLHYNTITLTPRYHTLHYTNCTRNVTTTTTTTTTNTNTTCGHVWLETGQKKIIFTQPPQNNNTLP